MYDETDDKVLLLNTVRKFMEDEMYPHEEKVDKLGFVPEEIGKPTGQDKTNNRPNAVAELGLDGAIEKLDDILSGAIASVPSCPGEAALCEIVRKQAALLTPIDYRKQKL